VHRLIPLFFAVALLVASRTAAAAEQPEHCPAGWESSVFVTAKASVVRITDGGGWGAGFLWKSSRRIVTAMHVVARARSFEIIFADGTHGRAHLVGGDKRNDIAILDLDGPAPPGLVPLELADPASLSVGEPIIALGHPMASGAMDDPRDEGLFAWTMTRGVLSAHNDHQVQVDIRIDHGNSGGPILDCEGRVIGVVSHGVGNLNFATGPRDLIALDQNPVLPGISFAPTDGLLRFGVSLRHSTFTSYGATLEGGVTFFGKLDVVLRGTGLFSLTSEATGDRIVSGRTGVHGWLGAGYQLRVLRALLIPNVGGSVLFLREHASRFVGGNFSDDSSSSGALRFAPGFTVRRSIFWLDYKMEIDFGRFEHSANLFTLGLSLR
jgi:hypothetical protein